MYVRSTKQFPSQHIDIWNLIPQFPSKDESIDKFFTIRQPCRLWNTTNHAETQLLPDANGSWIVREHQVEDGIFIALVKYISIVGIEASNSQTGLCSRHILASAQTPSTLHPWRVQRPYRELGW